MTRAARALACGVALAVSPLPARAQGNDGVVVDAVAVRFYAPETGGAARPRFISNRTLAFEARLEAKAEDATTEGYQERHVRSALDRHVAEELLASLPLERAPDEAELQRIVVEVRSALVQRVGGEEVLAQLAAAEGLHEPEITSMLRRRARAAIYLERDVQPILYPSEEQLREVFRTSANPFKSQKFEDVRQPLSRWYVEERLRSAEAAFLQAARTRVNISPTRVQP